MNQNRINTVKTVINKTEAMNESNLAEETKVFVCDETIEKYKVLEDKLMTDEDLIKIETHIRNLQKKIGYYKSQLDIKEKLIAKLINL